jgi:hypothetical protein
MWTRRGFLASAGAGFAATLMPRGAEALERADLVFAAAGRAPGGFVATLVSERGELISTVPIPARGHDVAQCPVTGRLVVFAWRPGTFAVVFDPAGQRLQIITSPESRHFYGHGDFSPDGKLMYAAENDFDAARGVIGVYDATDSFKRIGEFDSSGVGPHEAMVSPDGRYLVIGNGGIETHPDFGRAKLNLSTMEPNIAFLDRETGDLVSKHNLPAELHQLSLRHVTRGASGRYWAGAQYQGSKGEVMPVVVSVGPDEPLTFADLPEDTLARLRNYVGAVATSPDGERIAVTSPVGGAMVVFNERAEVLETSGVGDFVSARAQTRMAVEFDHHLLTLT